MNDLYTLLQVRDELEKNYEFAKKFESARHQWSGLLAARNVIHRMIQEEVDARDNQEEAA
jgi:hypothetical protein